MKVETKILGGPNETFFSNFFQTLGTDNKNEFYAVEASEIRKNEQNELCIQQQAQLLTKPTRRVALRSISDLM